MRLLWGRIVLVAIATEVLAVAALFLFVALFGPNTQAAAEAYAQRHALWLGPLASSILCLAGGYWVAKGAPTSKLANGATVGVVAAAIDVTLLVTSGAPFQPIFAISNAGRLLAGFLGAWLGARKAGRPSP